MTTRSAAELRADYETVMGPELGAIYAELVQELCNIYVVWGQYKILFGTKKSRVDLLNKAGGTFIRVAQDCIFDQVILAIARFTDKPEIAGKQTLTIRRLAALISDAALADAVRTKVDLAMTAQKFCRDWRNNRIGHNNLDMRINPNARALLPATRLKVDAALTSLAEVLNIIASHFLDSETAYDHIVTPLPDAEWLLYTIHDGLAVQDERRKRRQAGDYSIEAYPRDL